MFRRLAPFIVLAIAIPLPAQTRCRATDTPRQCFERWVAASVKRPEAPAAQAVKTVLASVNDGVSDLNAPVQASLKDFLTILSGSLNTAVVGSEETGVSFGYTPPMDLHGHLRLETKFTKPVLSGQASAGLGDADRKKLEATLTALDDVKWALSYDWTTRFLGRDVRRHRPLLAALVPPPPDAQSAFVQALAASSIAVADAEKSFGTVTSAEAFENAVRGAGAPTPVETDFASLLNNQPQLYVTGAYHARRDIVGPRSYEGTVTFELAGRNLNGFYRNEGRDCGATCAEALKTYLVRIRDPRNAPRIALSASYTSTESVPNPAVPPDPNAPDNDISRTFRLSGGVPFLSFVTGKEGRLEAGVEYNGTTFKRELSRTTGRSAPVPAADIISPPLDRSVVASPIHVRGSAAVTYTQALSDRLSVPVSLVYRDVEYVARHRQELFIVRDNESAVHVGLRYRIGPSRPAPRCCC
ncbi:MAG TPA: hypothetical protein VFP80_14855 [Thermoanaerobaculia bacterium]|nr:hypothetical protein [Thermoanaerobaculia bacterium]